MKKTLSTFIKICLAVGLIYWLVSSGKVNFMALKGLLSLQNLLVCFAILFGNLALASERWRQLIATQISKLTFFETFKLTLIGQFFNFAMPGGVGGDVIKAYYFAKDHAENGKTVAITSVLIDRVLGLFAMLLFALLVMLMDIQHIFSSDKLKTLFAAVLFLFAGFSAALTVLFSHRLFGSGLIHKVILRLPLKDKLHKLYKSFHLYGKNKKQIFNAIFLSLGSQLLAVIFLYFAAHATGYPDIPFYTFLLVAPIGFMATAIPISPAGVGIGQAAFYFLFNLYLGYESDVGAVTITAFQVANFCFGLIGAFFYISRKDRKLNLA